MGVATQLHIQAAPQPGYKATSQLAAAYKKRRLSGTNLSSKNNLPTFRLNAHDDWYM